MILRGGRGQLSTESGPVVCKIGSSIAQFVHVSPVAIDDYTRIDAIHQYATDVGCIQHADIVAAAWRAVESPIHKIVKFE
jgi:hypothetical protein